MGGAISAIESSYMKQKLVESNAKRLEGIETGDQTLVGVNKFNQTEPSPLSGGEDSGILTVDPQVEVEAVDKIKAWRAQRDNGAVEATLAALRQAAEAGENIMEPSIACAKAGVTTGEWGQVLRDVFGEYRAPTGVGKAARVDGDDLSEVRDAVNATSDKLGRRLKILVGKPGLDGHSNGAEQIAVRARDSGMEVVYQGIRLTPEQIVNTALEEGVHVVGLSILSGSHLALVGDVMQQMKEAELDDVPVIVGGIIPPADEEELKSYGVSAVYTPKDFQLNEIMKDIADLVGKQA
jgi:(2R)-ethylmalonyl-CoA mutase